MNKIYLVKNLAPWMLAELMCLANEMVYSLILLRQQKELYKNEIVGLQQMGVTIKICPFNNSFSFKKLLFSMSFVIKNVTNLFGQKNLAFCIKAAYWFYKLEDKIFDKESYIHAQFATQAALVALMYKKYKGNCNYSFTFHAHDIYFKNRWLAQLIHNSTIAFSISDFNVEYVKKRYAIDNNKLHVSKLGVQQINNLTIRRQNKHFRVGFLSWFEEKKGIKYLLEAINSIVKEYSDINFELAGDGEYFKYVNEFIINHSIDKQVVLLGKVYDKDKDAFFKRIDLFVLPSISVKNDMDGLPVVLMEAISYGIPIISTNISGIPEICINEKNGLLIEQRNVNEIIKSILKIRNNPALYSHFSKNSLEMAKDYDIEKNTKSKFIKAGWIKEE